MVAQVARSFCCSHFIVEHGSVMLQYIQIYQNILAYCSIFRLVWCLGFSGLRVLTVCGSRRREGLGTFLEV